MILVAVMRHTDVIPTTDLLTTMREMPLPEGLLDAEVTVHPEVMPDAEAVPDTAVGPIREVVAIGG